MNITITGAKIYILSIVLLISSHMFSTIDTVGRQNELFGQRLLETPPPPSSGETNTDPNTSSGTDPNTSSGTDPNTSTSSGTDTSNSDYKPPPPMDDVSQTQNQTNITPKEKEDQISQQIGDFKTEVQKNDDLYIKMEPKGNSYNESDPKTEVKKNSSIFKPQKVHVKTSIGKVYSLIILIMSMCW